ncbi:MAG: hypothetical protein ACC645_03275, partial [Pirellulales bacterium]
MDDFRLVDAQGDPVVPLATNSASPASASVETEPASLTPTAPQPVGLTDGVAAGAGSAASHAGAPAGRAKANLGG